MLCMKVIWCFAIFMAKDSSEWRSRVLPLCSLYEAKFVLWQLGVTLHFLQYWLDQLRNCKFCVKWIKSAVGIPSFGFHKLWRNTAGVQSMMKNNIQLFLTVWLGSTSYYWERDGFIIHYMRIMSAEVYAETWSKNCISNNNLRLIAFMNLIGSSTATSF